MYTLVDPSPKPVVSTSVDPFAPDPTIWPEAPGWLFPSVMTALGMGLMVVVVLLFMWRRAVVVERERRAQQPAKPWVDLSKLDRKGRWEDQDQPPAGPDER